MTAPDPGMRCSRRDALRLTAAVVTGLATGGRALGAGQASRRPPAGSRAFTSQAVEETIRRTAADIADPELSWLFANCYPNTLDTTVRFSQAEGKPDTFVITGDIEAMWLRDSSAQVWPYLQPAREDPKLRSLLEGVIRRQARCILIDPYANAFNDGPKRSEWTSDLTDMKPELHERKWEIDSLCYPVRLSYGYWQATGDTAPFDRQWREAMRAVVRTFREQQRREGPGPYHFQRRTTVWYDTLPLGGYGNPARPVGLIHSGFRPSDDACIYPLLIPANLFAVISLRQLARMAVKVAGDTELAGSCQALAGEVEEAVRAHGIARTQRGEEIYAYEVDGFGSRLLMDDANVPSLLALPYLGCCAADDPLYRRTRAFVLSTDNPYFFTGRAAEGVGGPHVGLDMIWHLALIMRAMTSADDGEILWCLRTLKGTHAGTGFMHESFHKDNPATFTRPWFAWANTLFGELILRIHRERPQLLARA